MILVPDDQYILSQDSKIINRSLKKLIQVTVFVSMTTYMVGYHVHEKAIIIPSICQGLLLIHNSDEINNQKYENSSTAVIFLLLSMSGTYSLFPLFVELQEFVTKGRDEHIRLK